MSYSVSLEGFDSLTSSWSRLLDECPGCSPFVTPQWQKTWWRHFGRGEPLLLAVRYHNELVGIAPLMKTSDGCLSLLGSSDVCDYLDFVVLPQHARGVCQAVLDYVQPLNWHRFDLFSMKAGSTALEHFVPLLRAAGSSVEVQVEDVSPRLELPETWEGYLNLLSKKDRHELQRKMRRLYGSPDVGQETAMGGLSLHRDMEDFFAMFLESQDAKTAFLTPAMRDFFLDAVEVAAEMGWLRLFFLTIEGVRASAVLTFDYGDTAYLYNSGYYRRYAHLSVGLMLKASCIQNSISSGKRCFDFLRGGEHYKYDLGGHDIPVFRCTAMRAGYSR